MADQDDLYYLQPGFDLRSLTVPRLRSILVSQNIGYPSSAKKQDLLSIVEQEILPRSKKLLNAQARVRRTSKGITDVPSSQDEDGEDERELMPPPPPPPKTPRSRKSKSNLTDGEAVIATPKSSRKSRTPSARRKTIQASDTEPDVAPPTTSRRSRKSTPGDVPPTRVKIEDDPPRRSLAAAGESPFSDDNPFQSGSSPPSGAKAISTARPRTESRRRSTKSPPIKQEEQHNTYEIPVATLGRDRNGVEVTEEFTDDAGRELAQDLANDTQLARRRNAALTRRSQSGPSSTLKASPFVILTLIFAGLGGWYRQEKINIGYCGVGQPHWSLEQNPNIPAWVHDNLQPSCEPCPAHATCFADMEAQCDDNFLMQPHPLSLNGLLPLPPTCEPDSEKERRIKAVADRAVEELRERRATYECGGEMSADPAVTTKPQPPVLEVEEETLKKEVGKMRRRGMSEGEFNDLWQGALENIVERDEVEVILAGSGRRLLKSNSFANLPFTCAIRRSLVRTLRANTLPAGIVVSILAAIIYVRSRLLTYQQSKAQIPNLVALTLDRLATQAALKEDGRAVDAFISVGQLRDDVLRSEFNAVERARVWQRVAKIVEGNSNIRASTQTAEKSGEVSRVWEWIGPIDFVPGLEGRRSGLINRPETPEQTGAKTAVRRWDEGRPIF